MLQNLITVQYRSTLSSAPFSIHLFKLLVILSFCWALKRSDSLYLAFKYVFISFSYPLITSGAWASSIILTHHIFFKSVVSKGSRLVRTPVGRFDTATNSSSSAAWSTTVTSSSDLYLSLSGSWCISRSSPRCFHSTRNERIAISDASVF